MPYYKIKYVDYPEIYGTGFGQVIERRKEIESYVNNMFNNTLFPVGGG